LAPGSHLGKRTDVEAPLGAPHSATGRSGRASPSSPRRSLASRGRDHECDRARQRAADHDRPNARRASARQSVRAGTSVRVRW
jgi:hypothetical protein